MFGCTGSSLLFGVFSCGERGLLFAVVQALLITVAAPVRSAGSQRVGLSVWHQGSTAVARRPSGMGSVAVVHRLGWSEACGIFSNQISNWQADAYPLHHQERPGIEVS